LIIDTKFSGQIEINEQDILKFEEGLLGFEDLKKYVLIDIDDFFKSLQSIDRKEAAFIVINPWDVFKDYEIDINDKELLAFNDKDINNFRVLSILTITQQNMTANLIGPVVINTLSGQGKQIVLYKSNYTTKHNIMQYVKKE
jgi:flagellar assembly factor FliW